MFSIVSKIIKMSGSYRPRVIVGLLFQVLKSCSASLMLFSILILTENAAAMTWPVIGQAFAIVLLSVLLQFVFQWLVDIMLSSTGYHIFKEKRLEIGARLKRASMGYFSQQNLGNIQSALTTTISALEEYAMMMVSLLVGGVIQAVAMTVMLFFFCPPAALLTLAGLVVGLAAMRLVTVQSDKYAGEMQLANEDLVGKSLEFIQGIAVLRSFGKGAEGRKDILDAFERKKNSDINSENGIAWAVVLYQTVFKVTSCAMLLLAPLLYLGGQIALPVCLMLVISAFMIYSGFENMANGALLSRVINAQLKRLEEITDIEVIDEDGKCIRPESFDIELENVSFAYDGNTVIDDVSLHIPEKSSCAIVGPSGSGKTTLCRLIARFWDVNQGRITMGGHDLKEFTCDGLLDNISIVFQNVYLFQDTIAGNIRFGKPDATDAEVIEVAMKACCHDFISALPDGYETMVGEGGHTLSGGEKQRISIARAMLKDTPIVIFDEATASVDPENEGMLMQALERLTANKTTISIAHRMKTVQNADMIIVLDNGKITEMGDHAHLMEQNGMYHQFVKMRETAAVWQV